MYHIFDDENFMAFLVKFTINNYNKTMMMMSEQYEMEQKCYKNLFEKKK